MLHILRQGGLKGKPYPGEGLFQLQSCRVEGGAGDEGRVLGAVEKVPSQRVAQIGHMDPDLVCPPGLQPKAEEGEPLPLLYDLIVGPGGFAIGPYLLPDIGGIGASTTPERGKGQPRHTARYSRRKSPE